jgi:hypothetical protein
MSLLTHRAVKNEIVEDGALGRKVKEKFKVKVVHGEYRLSSDSHYTYRYLNRKSRLIVLLDSLSASKMIKHFLSHFHCYCHFPDSFQLVFRCVMVSPINIFGNFARDCRLIIPASSSSLCNL